MHRLAAAVLALGACRGAITLEVASDRPVPQALDAMCVGVADASPHGGHFGRTYPLTGKQASFPQTLRVDPGGADAAWAWVRGDRAGSETVRAGTRTDFAADVTLALDHCIQGPDPTAHVVGAPAGPPGALLAASQGAGGWLVVAVAPGASTVIDARDGALTVADGPALMGNPVAVLAMDVDGDCDDDIVVATDSAPPQIWLREGASFVASTSLQTMPVKALAAADVDHDGDLDLVVGGDARLELWLDDGAGAFTQSSQLAPDGATAITALALGDVTGDGNVDLIAGQAGAPLMGWVGSGGGFTVAPALIPAVSLDVERLVMVDADYDYVPDLAVSITGMPMRLYLARDGMLEDRTFEVLQRPLGAPPPAAHAIAIGPWDSGCEPDMVVASDAGAPMLHGNPGGTFTMDGTAPGATDVIMVDIDDDGDLDAVVATPTGVQWLAR